MHIIFIEIIMTLKINYYLNYYVFESVMKEREGVDEKFKK